MTVVLAALTIGVVLSLLALGVFISFRVFSFADITADGSITLGACVTAVLLVTEPTPMSRAWQGAAVAGAIAAGLAFLFLAERKALLVAVSAAVGIGLAVWGFVFAVLCYRNPILATAAGFAGGLAAGMTTGILHTRFQINRLLSGILVMTALYSVNLHVLGKSNVSFKEGSTLADRAGDLGKLALRGRTQVNLLGWEVGTREVAILALGFAGIVGIAVALYAFFRTRLGTAMRATGDCPQMMSALGVNVGNMMVVGLALSNGLIALSGSLYAQYQGFADVQMGIGMVVWGLASVIVGEALVGSGHLGLTLAGAVMGSVLFRLLIAIALRLGLDPVDLKLITAVFVLAALVFPTALARVQAWLGRRPASAKSSPAVR
jgi:putative ABC transport system permease protein